MKFVSLNEHKFVISVKQKYKKMLPIALKSFHFENCKEIRNIEVLDISPETQWIFLTGENGFGKTSLLQSLALGLMGGGMFHGFISKGKYQIMYLEYLFNKKIYPIINADDIYKSEFPDDFGNYINAYGSSRLLISSSIPHERLERQSASIDNLFSGQYLLINIEERLRDWHQNYQEGFKRLETLFKELLPRLGKISVEFNQKSKNSEVIYYEMDDEGNLFPDGVDFNQLASGYKNIIAMIGDMVYRFSLRQNVENLNELKGIVLIDEIDLHLHPKYQKLFVQKLTELFPQIQFIVSTHSPIPLLGAPKNSVIINVSRTREEGIKAELLDIDFSVLTPNAILSSPIFGFQDLIPESKSDDKMIRTEDTFQEVEFNDQLKKNINQFLTKERQEELLKLIKVKQKS
jgi:predicted ATP-binding protein involved in virulence